MFRHRGIMRKMLDQNVRLMGMAYNKLLLENKDRTNMLRDKMRFVIETLSNKDSNNVLLAYNALKERKMMLDGVGIGDKGYKKVAVIKKLIDRGFDLMFQGLRALRDYYKWEIAQEEEQKYKLIRDEKAKEKIIKDFVNSNLREQRLAYRTLK